MRNREPHEKHQLCDRVTVIERDTEGFFFGADTPEKQKDHQTSSSLIKVLDCTSLLSSGAQLNPTEAQ